MDELKNSIFKLIEENKSINEIKSILNISNKELIDNLNELRCNGISIDKEYHTNGNISFALNKERVNYDVLGEIKLIKTNISKIKMLVISDLHLDSFRDRVDLLDKAYQYAKDNNINIILNTGDLIDGNRLEYSLVRHKTMYEQFKYLLNNYPYDKDIINLIVLGNHDIYPIYTGFNIINLLESNRLDLVPVGINYAKINIGNSSIGLYHPISEIENYISNYYNITNDSTNEVNLIGHFHVYKKEFNKNRLFVRIPTLSNILLQDMYDKKKMSTSQGMIELFLMFQNESIKTAQIKYLKVDPYIRVCDEKRYCYKKR